MPAVSVLLPVRNSAATLQRALDSLLCQSMSDFEILAVDDGSTDESLLMLEQQVRRDPRIRVMRLARPQGLSAALNYRNGTRCVAVGRSHGR